MALDLALLSTLILIILALMLRGRVRHDLVAAGGLLIAVVLGLVPEDDAFSGFSNHAVIIVALVLIASRAFENSGALSFAEKAIARKVRPIARHIAFTSGIAAALSAVINNVAALALLMPLDIQAARKAGRPPGITLMPLAFATILGGMVTLIGTPPNIIASAIRTEHLGKPFGMFDFAPVGLSVAIVGILFIALVGWRLVPSREDKAAALVRGSSFKAELVVPPESSSIGRILSELDQDAEACDILVMGLLRKNERYTAIGRSMPIAEGDVMLIEGSTDSIAEFIKVARLQAAPDETKADVSGAESEAEAADSKDDAAENGEPQILEAAVRADSRLIGRSAKALNLRGRFSLTLLGIARAGDVERAKVHERIIRPGDVLLLTSSRADGPSSLDRLGLLPVNEVNITTLRPIHAVFAIGLFLAALLAATTGQMSFTIAIAIAVAGYAALGLVPAREFYDQIEWSVIVMLACLLPIGSAFNSLGGTAFAAEGIVQLTEHHAPYVALVAIMIVTMTLSDVLNNVATMVIAGPIAIDLGQRLNANPDTFLMGVAVAASCAFLTPIGHKNNTLIMGPGGFRFADYWRMGLPLELVVLAVSVPALLLVWPL